MKNKQSIFDAALNIGNEAPLQVNTEKNNAAPAQRTVRTKTLKAIPTTYFDAHQKLRDTNKTNLDFSNYIMEALREKLEREGGILGFHSISFVPPWEILRISFGCMKEVSYESA